MSNRPKLMNHEDRQRLIRAPISFRVIEKRIWAGCLVPDAAPRLLSVYTDDEAFQALSIERMSEEDI